MRGRSRRWGEVAFVGMAGAAGGAGVSNLLDLIDKEMRVAMTLTGAKTIADITQDCLVRLDREISQ